MQMGRSTSRDRPTTAPRLSLEPNSCGVTGRIGGVLDAVAEQILYMTQKWQ